MAKEVFICRAPRKADNFTHLPNALLQTKELSPECLGILVHLLSRPPNWKVMPEVLADHYDCSKDRIYRILKDLQATGYVVRRTLRNGSGISEWRYWVFDEPQLDLNNPDINDRYLLPEIPEEGNSRNGKNPTLNKDRDSEKERDSRPAKKQDMPYSEEFENEVWKPYPRKAGTSKKKGWDMFRMLTPERQQQVKIAIPLYAEMMRKEGRPEDKIKHLQFWLSDRMYETIGAAPRTGDTAAPADWHKTASRRQWEGVLMTWLNLGAKDADWRKVWGPRPGELGCGLPDDMLDRFNLEHRGYLFSKVEYESLKSKVENSRVVA